MADSINTSFGVSESPFPLSNSIMPSTTANQYQYYNIKPKSSPITYLIETEEEYISDLQCLLQQVTRSWDRDNPLPPELKVMFNIVDDIYYYNNNFLSRLKQAGTDLMSAKELSDVLMAWVEEMEGPYAAYCQNYRRGIDLWPEIDNNLILQQELNSISAQRNQPITLDFLFEIPLKRIHYYKKSYTRILKSSEPGGSDYDILAAAIKRIDSLIKLEKKAKETFKPRENIPILQSVSSGYASSVKSQGDVPIPQTVSNGYISPVISQGDIPTPQVVSNEYISPVISQGDIPTPQTVSNEYISPVMSQGDIPIPQTVSNEYISPVMSQEDIPIPQTVSNEYISPVMSQEDIPTPQTISNEYISPVMSQGDIPIPQTVSNEYISPVISQEDIPIPQTVSNEYISPVMSQEDIPTPQTVSNEYISPVMSQEDIPTPQAVSNEYISPVISQGDIPTVSNEYISPVTSQEVKNPESVVNLTLPEFESQLDTSRVVDFFTKQPKTFNVELSPPHLPFKREIILNNDFIVILSDEEGSNNHRAHVNAHLILFTDLLLICQRLTPEEKALNPTKDFWLLYPPLSGRHLRVTDMYDSKEELLKVVALERESIVIVAENRNIKEIWLEECAQSIEFARAASSRSQSSTSSNSHLTISTQEARPSSPSAGNFSVTESGRTLSPPGNLRSPGQLKVGLPSSPLSNNAPLRSRSPDVPKIVAPPQISQISSDYLRIEETPPRTNSVSSSDSFSSIGSFTDIIYQSPPCEVSCWVVEEWIPMTKRDNCIVEIKMTTSNRPCLVVSLESNGRIILNAWIHPATSLIRESSCSTSLSCEMGQVKEFYKVTMTNHMDSDEFFSNVLRMKNHRSNELVVQGFVSRSSSLKNNQAQEIEQTLTNVMESRIKLFLQSDHGMWKNLGWGSMRLLLETPSHRKRIIITRTDKQKSKLVDSFVDETGVGKLNRSSITFKINNISASGSIIYMMQMKDEASTTKAIEIMKTEQKY